MVCAEHRNKVNPRTTAVLTMELQRGVVGPEAMFKQLADEVAAKGVVAAAARVCEQARAAGARVVHCTAEARGDGAGTAVNCALLAAADRKRRQGEPSPIETGSDGARLMPELGEDPRDLIVARLHGLTPFTATSLDQILRNLGVNTVVVTGVSVNVGIVGACLSAVDLGYHTILVRDAVAGVPADFADALIDHTLKAITTVVYSEQIVWE